MSRRRSTQPDATDSTGLSPPRPHFLAARGSDRGSSSSFDSLDPASASDSDSPPLSMAPKQPKLTPGIRPKIRTSTSTTPQGLSSPTSPKQTRRRSTQHRNSGTYSTVEGLPQAPDPFADSPTTAEWNPSLLYQDAPIPSTPKTAQMASPVGTAFPTSSGYTELAPPPRFPSLRETRHSSSNRPPPSSFPFLSHQGNPDPGTHIPGAGRGFSASSRRSSMESIHNKRSSDGHEYGGISGLSSLDHSRTASDEEDNLYRPQAPFMAGGPPSGRGSPTNSIYRNSAAGVMMNRSASNSQINMTEGPAAGSLPRSSSASNMRAPFLAPSSRRNSTAWAPPNYSGPVQVDADGHPLSPNFGTNPNSPNASSSFLPYGTIPKRAPLRSTLLTAPLSKTEKPWLSETDRRMRLSWWITFVCIWVGVAVAAALCFFGVTGVRQFKDSELCSVMDDEFTGNDLDGGWWNKVVELGGFGNGEFEMATKDSSNLYTSNGQLYLHPTYTNADGTDIFHGKAFNLTGCTNTHNASACGITPSGNNIIPPVKSARITTKGKVAIQYGKVEVKAKIPRGDWLWPAIWMLPDGWDDDPSGRGRGAYGYWPLSGEIDIMEARGNDMSYSQQGINYVRSSLNYGPLESLVHQIFGWYSLKRSSFDKDFHTYSMEWDQDYMRFYTDNKLNTMLSFRTRNSKEGFFHRGGFPATAQNGSSEVVVQNPWSSSPNNNAPYDQPFYLIINLSVGGTSGWFPDNVGNKPWYDGEVSAMWSFAQAQSQWSATWPESPDDRAFRIESVKMWKRCGDSTQK